MSYKMSFLDSKAISYIRFLQRQAASLLLYQNVLSDEPGQAFLNLLQAICDSNINENSALNCITAYGIWFKAMSLTNQSWQDYLISKILIDDNAFSRQSQQQGESIDLPETIIAAAEQDMQALHSLYKFKAEDLSRWVQDAASLPVAPVVWDIPSQINEKIGDISIREKLRTLKKWTDAIEDLMLYYRKFGIGVFAKYIVLRWQSGKLIGIQHPDSVNLSQIVGYEIQKNTLVKNTEFLIAGYPALNVLLYGSRGSGKSSLVKSLVNQYSQDNLRLIEVAKADLQDLPIIVENLRGVPQKFIIFVDDLSFEEDDESFKNLKVVLEGGVMERPQNVVVYATSNRRHLVREFFADRPRPVDANEVFSWDTVQEKLSFSDRFGLTLTFEPADQKTYLEIVNHLATQAGINNISQADLEYTALQWTTRHNGRSGRTAKQFIDFLRADLALSPEQ